MHIGLGFIKRGFGGHHGGRHGGFGGMGGFMNGSGLRPGRMIGSDDLQLIILALLEEKPRHGYDIIKELADRSSGIYSPSPGVVYPALTYLEEAGHAVSEQIGNKKLFTITAEGSEYLKNNRELADETLERLKRLGLKMARMQKHLADEEAENELDHNELRNGSHAEWRKIKFEFQELKAELKEAIYEKIMAPMEEKKRVMAILRRTLQEIRGE